MTAKSAAGSAAAVSEPVGPVTAGEVSLGGAFHGVARTRIADGVSVAAGATVNVPVLGRGGVPAGGVGAVALDVTVSNSAAGAASVAVFPAGGARPATRLAVPGAGTAVRFAEVAPGAGGAVSVFTDVGPTAVSVDVIGWVAAEPEPGTAGLFTGLTPAAVLDTRDGTGSDAPGALGAASETTVQVAGVAGVPASGTAAVVVNVTAIAPTAATTLAVHASDAAGPFSPNVVAAAGAVVSNRAVVPVGPDGRIAVAVGAGASDVVVDVNGWYSDGSDPGDSGARFVTIPQARLVTSQLVAAGTPLVVPMAGRAGVPAMTGEVPPTAVVVGVTAAGASTGSVRVHPAGFTAPLAVDATVPAGGAASNLVVAKLGPDGSVAVTADAAGRVSVDVYGYLVGDVVVADQARILSATSIGAITSVAASKVTFNGNPPQLADVAVGDVIVAGVTPTTPSGLLRRVTAVSGGGGNLELTTEAASVAEAIRQGDLHYDSATPSAPAQVMGGPGPSISVGISRGWGFEQTWEHKFIDQGGLEAGVRGTLAGTANLNLDLDAGFTHFDFAAEASVSAHADASLFAEIGASVDACLDLPSIHLATITLTVGPVPLVFVVDFAPSVCAKGSVKAKMTGGVTTDASARVGVRHEDGDTTPVQDANFTFNANSPSVPYPDIGTATLAVTGKADLTISVDGVQILKGGLGFTVRFELDGCMFPATFLVDAHASLEIKIWKWDIAAIEPFQKQLAEVILFELPIASCAYWTGTITATRDSQGHDERGNKIDEGHWSATVTLVKPTPFKPKRFTGTIEYRQDWYRYHRDYCQTGDLRVDQTTTLMSGSISDQNEWKLIPQDYPLLDPTFRGILFDFNTRSAFTERSEQWNRIYVTGWCGTIVTERSGEGGVADQLFDLGFHWHGYLPVRYDPSEIVLQGTHESGSPLVEGVSGTYEYTEWNLEKHCTIGPPTNC